jgi:hypothetical protein
MPFDFQPSGASDRKGSAMWDEKQQAQVAELLRQFNGAEEVCAITRCSPDELDALSQDAFKCSFEQAKAVFAAQGRAMVRNALMSAAMEGNIKAIDMLCREQMGMGPVESRAKTMKAKEAEADADGNSDGGGGSSVLKLVQGKARKPA